MGDQAGIPESGEGVVLLEGTSDGFAAIWADIIASKTAVETKRMQVSRDQE